MLKLVYKRHYQLLTGNNLLLSVTFKKCDKLKIDAPKYLRSLKLKYTDFENIQLKFKFVDPYKKNSKQNFSQNLEKQRIENSIFKLIF